MTQAAGEKSYSKRQKTVNIVIYVILAVMAVIGCFNRLVDYHII